MGFSERIQQAALLFRERVREGPISIVARPSVDGIAALAILIRTFDACDYTYTVTYTPYLDDSILSFLATTSYSAFFFLDFQANDSLEKKLPNKDLFFFSHFPSHITSPHFVHINPFLDGLDGAHDISTAGLCYFFAKAITPVQHFYSALALVGAVGCLQEHSHGFLGHNRDILKDALNHGGLSMKEGFRILGVHTQPLAKLLSSSIDPYLPGLSGQRNVLEHLRNLLGNDFKDTTTLDHLTQEQLHILHAFLKEKSTAFFNGWTYTLTYETSIFRSLLDYYHIISACIASGKFSIAAGVCLQDRSSRQQALTLFDSYKYDLLKLFEWFSVHHDDDSIVKGTHHVFLSAPHHSFDRLLEPFICLLSKALIYPQGTLILGIAPTIDGQLALSAYTSGLIAAERDAINALKTFMQQTTGIYQGQSTAASALLSLTIDKGLLHLLSDTLEKAPLQQHLAASLPATTKL